MNLADDMTLSIKRQTRRRSPAVRASPAPFDHACFPTSSCIPMPRWEDVRPGDWIRAASAHGASVIQGVVESVHTHPEYGVVVSVNDTRRTALHWQLLEVRAC